MTMARSSCDLRKQYRTDYVASRKPRLVHVSRGRYLTIRGADMPAGIVFQEKINALYAVADALKAILQAAGHGYVVRLEGIWDMDVISPASVAPGSGPSAVSEARVAEVVGALAAEGKTAWVSDVRVETLPEQDCVQALHRGAYGTEATTVAELREYVLSHGLKARGQLHSIYLSNPRYVPPEHIQTIVRLPVLET
jgi:hypothetical protein